MKSIHRNRGDAGVREWQRLPYLEIPETVITTEPVVGFEQTMAGTGDLPFPWDDFVVQMPAGPAVPEDMQIIMRVMRPGFERNCILPDAYMDLVSQPIDGSCTDIGQPLYFVGIFTTDFSPVVVRVGLRANGSVTFQVGADPQLPGVEGIVKSVKWVVRTHFQRSMSHVLQLPEHMVERRPTVSRMRAKTLQHKPWLRDDLPSIILLDPGLAVREHGMGLPRGPQGERHAPIPHGRRGHWRRLSPERRTWVRPAWIGPLEWQGKGQTYRVLTDRRALGAAVAS